MAEKEDYGTESKRQAAHNECGRKSEKTVEPNMLSLMFLNISVS